MANKIKLAKILKALSPDPTSVDFAEFDKQVSNLKEQLTETIQVKTIKDVQTSLEKFKRKFNLQPLLDSMEKLKTSFDAKSEELFKEIEQKTEELSMADKERVEGIKLDIEDLKTQLSSLEETRKTDLQKMIDSMPKLTEFEDIVNEMMLEVASRLDSLENQEIEDWQKKLDELRMDLLSRLSQVGGGSMNRNIAIGGNSSVLSRYNDINLKAGSNVTITYTSNNTTKYTDVTISATGGGGSVGGTVRSVNNINTSQTAGSTSGTDYVYIASAGINVTLPTASTNTNLYTIKNISNSSVLVSRDGTDTIEGDTFLILSTKYTAVDLISDGTSNWNIT